MLDWTGPSIATGAYSQGRAARELTENQIDRFDSVQDDAGAILLLTGECRGKIWER